MSCGLPGVELDTESTNAIFPPGVVSLGGPSPWSIANSIEKLIVDPEARGVQARRASEWVRDFSWERASKVVEAAFIERLGAVAKDTRGTSQLSRPSIQSQRNVHASIVVPTLNGGSHFKDLVRVLNSQKAPWDYEVVIIDSESTDDTLNDAKGIQNVMLETIRKQEFNHGATRNLAASRSRGSYIAYLTQDALPTSEYWLFDLVSCLQHHDDAAGVFGKHYARPNASAYTKRDLTHFFSGFDAGPVAMSKDTEPSRLPSGEQRLQYLYYYSDNNSCMRRSVWEQVPYPEAEYGEDQLWARTIIEKGYKKVYSRHGAVYHSHDYDEKQTFERSAVEARFFKREFGWNVIDPREDIEVLIRNLNKGDTDWGGKNHVDPSEIELRKRLNEARVRGMVVGCGIGR